MWVVLVATYWPFTVDDTFITLRYAENVARGIGPTWNEVGPRAEGYSSPLWVAVLSIAAALGADLERAAKLLGAIAMLAAMALTAHLGWALTAHHAEDERATAAGLAAMAMGLAPATAIHAVSGMETALATMLAAAYAGAITEVVLRADARRCAIAAALGLAFSLTRPEANLVVGLTSLVALALVAPAWRTRFAGSVVALHALPGAIYFAWRAHYYGQLLPLPFYVKALVHEETLPGAAEALAFARAQWIERLDVGVALVVACAALRRRAAVLAIPALALWLFFFVPAHEMGFDFRFFQPLVPAMAALAAAGAITIRSRLGRARGLVPALALGAAVLSVAPWLRGSVGEKLDYGAGIARAHARIGRALGAIRRRIDRPVLATLDAGAIAFYSRWQVIDTWGLNDATIATSGVRDAEYVLAREPSVVIVISAVRDRFTPHFEHEQALWDGARQRGMSHVASFEFLPDYHLFALARPGSAEARALREAAIAR